MAYKIGGRGVVSTTGRATHTPEPWVVERFSASGRFGVTAPHSHTIATINHNAYIPEKVHEANARRIVACVNACEGVPTDALEAGVVREMVEALETALWIRSKLEPGDFGFSLKEWDQIAAVLAKLRGEASSTATNHDEEYEEWLRRAEEERYYNEYGRER